jgi:hypothetical protein
MLLTRSIDQNFQIRGLQMRVNTTLSDAGTFEGVQSNQRGPKTCEKDSITLNRKFKPNNLKRYAMPRDWEHYSRDLSKVKNSPPEIAKCSERFREAVSTPSKVKNFINLLSEKTNPSGKKKKEERIKNHIKFIGCLINCTDRETGRCAKPVKGILQNRNIGELAGFIGVHPCTVQRVLIELEVIGFIKVIRVIGQTSMRMLSSAFYSFIGYSPLKTKRIAVSQEKAVRKQYKNSAEPKSTVPFYVKDNKRLIVTEKSIEGLNAFRKFGSKPPD